MKAPKKIYLQVCGDCEENECQSCKFEDLEDNVTWSRDPIFKKDVEYTRTDALPEEVDLEKEIDSIWNPRFNLGWDDKSLLSINHEGFTSIAKHFYKLGLTQKGE